MALLMLCFALLASVNETITTSVTTVVYLFINGVQCFSNDYGEKTNDFGEGNGFSSHLQRDSQGLSTLTQLTKGPTGYVSQTRAGR